MPSASKSFKQNVWQLVFTPPLILIIVLSLTLLICCALDISKFVDARGSVMARKTAQLVYKPLMNNDKALVQSLLDDSLEDPYIRSLHVYLDEGGETIGSGPELLPHSDNNLAPNNLEPVRRETQGSIIFAHPIANKNGSRTIGWLAIEMHSSPFSVILYQAILTTIAIAIGCLFLSSFLATRLFRNIIDPLNHFKDVINDLAQGKLQARANPQRSREFFYLADAINNMAQYLELAQQDLQNHIEQSTQDLIETLETIEIKNIELEIARKEAVEASRIKSEFLANTSHEIRTPLNGILGFSALVLKTELDEQQTEYVNTIRDSAQGLLTVINGILDFSKIEAGKLTLDYAPLPLRKTVDETLQVLGGDAHEKNLQLIAQIDKNIPSHLLGDSLRFKQVLSNFVSNAIKFSERGEIHVRVNLIAQQETHLLLKVSVSDQGKGLTPAQQTALFKPFSQADMSSSREQGGTGLGLAICKGLVQRMNGEIGVESKIGEGSTFWFTARLGIDKAWRREFSLPNFQDHAVLLCGTNKSMLAQLQGILHDWNMNHHIINNIHDIFPAIRKTNNGQPFKLLLLDISPNEKMIQPVLLNSITEQLAVEFNCKVIVCATASFQRLMRTNGNNVETGFISKPIVYETFLKLVSEKLNISLSDMVLEEKPNAVIKEPIANVLLVDDNPANLQVASALLRGLNARVVQANSGLQAIDAYQQQPFDIIFMDIQMPGMDGFETTRRIRQLEKKSHRTPIIALTAHSLTEQKSELLIAGMDDCVGKPVSENQLAHIINRWVALNGKKEIVIPIDLSRESQPTPSTQLDTPLPVSQDTNQSGCVDIALCLKLANNKPALAMDMLRMMLNSLEDEKCAILHAASERDTEKLGELIHRLYGSCCYCGVPRLKNISGLLDKLLQAKNVEDVLSSIPALIKAMDDVIAWGAGRDLAAIFGVSE